MTARFKIVALSTILSILGGYYLTSTPQSIFASANPATLTFTLEASRLNPALGEEIIVSIYAVPPPDTPVGILSAYLQHDPSVIRINKVTPSSEEPFDRWTFFKAANNRETNRVEIMAAYLPLDQRAGDENYLTRKALLGTVALQLTSSQPTALTLVTDPATSGAKDAMGNDIVATPFSLQLTPKTAGTALTPIPPNSDNISGDLLAIMLFLMLVIGALVIAIARRQQPSSE